MTIDIRTLRVSAEMDASKFKSGVDQLATGAASAAASVKGIGAAVTETELKISRAGDSVAKLSRLYVDGYAGAEKFNSAIRSLGTAMDKGNLSAERAAAILDGIYKKYGMIASSSELAQKGQLGLAAAVEKANERFQQQNRLNPANNNANRFIAGNITSQFQDVAITSMMGQSPLTIGLQQGSQIAGALQMGGINSAKGAISALAGGISGLISPLSIVTIALTAGTAAAVQFFTKSGDEAKKTTDVLKDHEASIKAISDAYGDAMKSLQAYTDVSKTLVDLQSRASTTQLGAKLRTEQNTFLDQFGAQRNTRTIGGNTFFADSDYKP
ncbi:MAG TPA: phage tail length tape measure family protein, partial [Ensifer sp.]|nr:phage tail length tape measure family protein [Ensifer sp.]